MTTKSGGFLSVDDLALYNRKAERKAKDMVIRSISISPDLIGEFEWYLGNPDVVGKPINKKLCKNSMVNVPMETQVKKENNVAKDKKIGVPAVTVGTNKGAYLSLRVLDRMVLPNMCPLKGSLDDQRCVKSITNKVILEQDEATDVALTTREGRISWNKLRDFSREFHFTTKEIQFLKRRVKEMDLDKSITYDMLDVCEKIEKAKLETSKPHGKVA